MPLYLVRNDITKMNTDIVVNAANNRLRHGGGVCGAIFSAAGSSLLTAECDKIGWCATGEAVITSGCNLNAKYIIHTVGPVWHGGYENEAVLLYSCYMNSLRCALSTDAQSIAFPLISAGVYGFPAQIAVDVAVKAITDFLRDDDMDVYLVFFNKNTLLSGRRYDEIKEYITDNYADEYLIRRSTTVFDGYHSESVPYMAQCAQISECNRRLDDILNQLDESFSQALFRIIDEQGLDEVDVYKKANVDRKLFSKIRKDDNYKPKKTTAIAFAIALELDRDATNDLLKKAGYALSDSSKFDVIISYFIQNKNYNIFEINNALFDFDQVLLGQ